MGISASYYQRVFELSKSRTMSTTAKFSFLALVLLIMSGCRDKFTEKYRANVPIYQSFEDWRSQPVTMQSSTALQQTGKIYIYGHYLFVNEPLKGIHIYDNSDPSNPVALGFLPIVDNTDLAIKDNLLYVDTYLDLLVFDVSDPAHPQYKCRVENAFPSSNNYSTAGYDPSLPVTDFHPDKGIIIGWKQVEVSKEIQQQQMPVSWLAYTDVATSGSNTTNSPTFTGQGGSMAAFAINGNFLYTLEYNDVTAYKLSNSDCPTLESHTYLNRASETLFAYNNHLFIGTTTGMLIYDLSSPSSPSFVGNIDHINSCDPVVVQGNRAYATLRTGNSCVGQINQLLVIDVSNYSQPSLITSYNMENPFGLGIDGNTLFICDGSAGLKVYDATDDQTIDQHMIAHFQNVNAYDVIPYNGNLIMSATQGIYQYSYSDGNLNQLSIIPIQQ